jgi:hypothetical protein
MTPRQRPLPKSWTCTSRTGCVMNAQKKSACWIRVSTETKDASWENGDRMDIMNDEREQQQACTVLQYTVRYLQGGTSSNRRILDV